MSTVKQDALFLYFRLQGKNKPRQLKILEDALYNAQHPYVGDV